MRKVFRVGRVELHRAAPNEGAHELWLAQTRDSKNAYYGSLRFTNDETNDFIAAFEQFTGNTHVTAERIRIAQYVRSLRMVHGQTLDSISQLEAVADAILEGRLPGEPTPLKEQGGGTISCGPVTVHLDFCHEMGHTPEQIARLVDTCLTASKLEGKITAHRNGRTRQCKECENWTFPLPTRCHLCFPKKGSPTT